MKTIIIKPRYELWNYDGKNSLVETITKEDVLSIDRQSVDHFLSLDFGMWSFRTLDGNWMDYDLSEKTFGPILLMILDVVRCEPGEYFSPADIATLTKIDSLRNPNNLSARWRAIRLAHLETFRQSNFFLSKRAGGMGIAWNPSKTFMQIARIRNND